MALKSEGGRKAGHKQTKVKIRSGCTVKTNIGHTYNLCELQAVKSLLE